MVEPLEFSILGETDERGCKSNVIASRFLLGGIEERHAQVNRLADGLYGILAVRVRGIALRESHAAQAYG